MRNNQSDQGRGPRRIWKRLLTVLLTLVLMGTLAFFILLGVVLAGSHDDIQGEPGVMVILGCQVKPEGPSMLLQDRLNKALDYWKEHPDITIVVSGGQGPDEPVTEARAMADYLIQAGVPEDSLMLEEQSTTPARICIIPWTACGKRGRICPRESLSSPTASIWPGYGCWPSGRGLSRCPLWPRRPATGRPG